MSVLDQPPDAQALGSQLVFAVYDAVQRSIEARGPGYAWDRVRDVLDALLEAGVIDHAG